MQNSETAALWVDDEGSDRIIIAFAGLAKVFGGVPAFEFIKLLSDITAHKLFLVDHQLVWYQNGLPAIGDTVYEVAEYLRNACRRKGVRRIVTAGNSAGGYAAILFGILMAADEIHAFAPKTRLLGQEDFREARYFNTLQENLKNSKPILDLRTILDADGMARPNIFIHYPEGDALDTRHARHLADFPWIRLIGYPCSDHALVQSLKRHGILKSLLCAALDGDHDRIDQLVAQGRRAMNRERIYSRLMTKLFGKWAHK